MDMRKVWQLTEKIGESRYVYLTTNNLTLYKWSVKLLYRHLCFVYEKWNALTISFTSQILFPSKLVTESYAFEARLYLNLGKVTINQRCFDITFVFVSLPVCETFCGCLYFHDWSILSSPCFPLTLSLHSCNSCAVGSGDTTPLCGSRQQPSLVTSRWTRSDQTLHWPIIMRL